MLFFYYTSKVRVTGLEGDCAEDEARAQSEGKNAMGWRFLGESR